MAFKLCRFSVAQWIEIDAIHILELHAESKSDSKEMPDRATIITLPYSIISKSFWPLQCFLTQFIEHIYMLC